MDYFMGKLVNELNCREKCVRKRVCTRSNLRFNKLSDLFSWFLHIEKTDLRVMIS